MAAVDLARDRPGCRSRNWIRESRDFYARLSRTIWRHALRFSQESRKDTAAINTGCAFHRAPHSSCLRKHLSRRSRQPHTASAWKSQNHTPLSGKRSPATSIPGGRKISMSRNHHNALSSRSDRVDGSMKIPARATGSFGITSSLSMRRTRLRCRDSSRHLSAVRPLLFLMFRFRPGANPPRPWKSPIQHLVVWEIPAPQSRVGAHFFKTASRRGSSE